MRGYLHGGLLVDFVGELGPISKLRLVYFDVLVMLLQFAMLAVFLDRRELKRVMDAPIVLEPGTRATVPSRTQQDHDSEERGLRRFDRAMASERTAFLGQGEEEEEDTDSRTRRSEHHLDALYSGQIVIADLHIIDTIKSSWWWSYGPAE